MQTFNGGVWLELEDYALQNARKSDMKICVFTGPIFADDDPVKFGVQVPVEFWKVIAFVHDETDELCATGYTMSQRRSPQGRGVRFRAAQEHAARRSARSRSAQVSRLVR